MLSSSASYLQSFSAKSLARCIFLIWRSALVSPVAGTPYHVSQQRPVSYSSLAPLGVLRLLNKSSSRSSCIARMQFLLVYFLSHSAFRLVVPFRRNIPRYGMAPLSGSMSCREYPLPRRPSCLATSSPIIASPAPDPRRIKEGACNSW